MLSTRVSIYGVKALVKVHVDKASYPVTPGTPGMTIHGVFVSLYDAMRYR